MHAGTEEDWIAAYRAAIRPLYAYVARRSGGDRALAEDVTQEAWLRAVESWRAKGPPEDALAWLSAVAHNLLRNHFRRARPEAVEPQALALALERSGAKDDPHEPGARAAALVQWGLARLSASQARLLEARYLEGKAPAVLARELGLSERAIEGRSRRSRLALERRLSPYLKASKARED